MVVQGNEEVRYIKLGDPPTACAERRLYRYLMRFETFVPHPDVPIDTEERGKDGPMQVLTK